MGATLDRICEFRVEHLTTGQVERTYILWPVDDRHGCGNPKKSERDIAESIVGNLGSDNIYDTIMVYFANFYPQLKKEVLEQAPRIIATRDKVVLVSPIGELEFMRLIREHVIKLLEERK